MEEQTVDGRIPEERPDGCSRSGDDVDWRKTGHVDYALLSILTSKDEYNATTDGARGRERETEVNPTKWCFYLWK